MKMKRRGTCVVRMAESQTHALLRHTSKGRTHPSESVNKRKGLVEWACVSDEGDGDVDGLGWVWLGLDKGKL